MKRGIGTRRPSFTLTEILVVIAIIGVLLAILLPVLNKVRRKAMVLACPIAYLGSDNGIHLTDPTGRMNLRVWKGEKDDRVSMPFWSPSGQKLAFVLKSHPKGVLIVIEPMAGKTNRFTLYAALNMLGWQDSSTVILGRGGLGEAFFDAETGLEKKRYNHEKVSTFLIHHISRLPPGHDASYVVQGGLWGSKWGPWGLGPDRVIALANREILLRKVIWAETPWAGPYFHSAPAVDSLGDWIAWTRRSATAGGGGRGLVALKRIKDLRVTPPTLIGQEFESVMLCDWTDQGQLLVTVKEKGVWSLAILSKDGKLLQKLPTEVPPASGTKKSSSDVEAPVATFRKYGHF